jgi:hypothetical protein
LLQDAQSRGVKKISIWSDNGPHFHCTDFFDSLKTNGKKFGIEVELDFFEVGEGKSDLDRHFGSSKQSVKRRVKTGTSLNGSLSELLTAVSETVKNTSVYEIQPERKRKKEFYKSYQGTNPVRSVRLITEEVETSVKEKLMGSLASGCQFFHYEFGDGQVLTRKKGNNLSKTIESPASTSSSLQGDPSSTVASETSSTSYSSSSPADKVCLLCKKPVSPTNKSKKHRACVSMAKKERVGLRCMLLRRIEDETYGTFPGSKGENW